MQHLKKIGIVTPVYNDWSAFALLLEKLGAHTGNNNYDMHVIAVDDGSFHSPPTDIRERLGGVTDLQIVRLASNLGHQRAIAVGLVTAFEANNFDAVVIMDSDGEDRPADVYTLLAGWEEQPNVVFVARRAQRSETISFRCLYRLYKALFRILTGHSIGFGNFCLLPKSALQELVHNPAIWNNLAAAIKRSPGPRIELPINRGHRLSGASRMNFVSLALHGISAISVYIDVVLVRIIITALLIGAAVLAGLLAVVVIKFATDWAIPGWASYVTGLLTIIFIQTLLMAGLALFQLLSFRSLKPFVPVSDAMAFVADKSITLRRDQTRTIDNEFKTH
jgi:glycosyltransferase involved in cell wall biosynthesis